MKQPYDAIIIGAGAAGMMCAITAAGRGKRILLLDHNSPIGKKIIISGGGRCNFTNLNISSDKYLSQNAHFCKSALARFQTNDFLKMVDEYSIHYYEKKLGQLFCKDSSKKILKMLLSECTNTKVLLKEGTRVQEVQYQNKLFFVTTGKENYQCQKLVIATGGLSFQKLGATDFGYKIAKQFGLKIIPPRPALVPLTWDHTDLKHFQHLSGISVSAKVSYGAQTFTENILFTHRGLSGPAILQISSYLNPGASFNIHLCPEHPIKESIFELKKSKSQMKVNTFLIRFLPKRLVSCFSSIYWEDKKISSLSDAELNSITDRITHWTVQPIGNEGYRKAEVTLGGVDTNELSSKTMSCNKIYGLYFIGEVIDVTGHLGGYNFQWAWASGHAAGIDI